MVEQSREPSGVNVLGWLHVLAGIGGAGLVAASAVLLGNWREGIPLGPVALAGVLLFLGPGLGLALRRGRPWAWHWAGWVYALGAGVIGFGAVWGLAADLAAWPSVAVIATKGVALAAMLVAVPVLLLCWVYLQVRSVREFFGRGRAGVWGVPVAHVVVTGAVLAVWGLTVERSAADAAVDRLQMIGDAGIVQEGDTEFLLDRLANGNAEERLSAAWALGQCGIVHASDALLDAARDDGNSNVRINAIAALIDLGVNDVDDELPAFLEDDDEQVQAAALRGLARFGMPESALPAVEHLLRNGGDAARTTAVDLLGKEGIAATRPLLEQATADALADVRSRAAFALGKLGDKQSVPALIALLGDESWEVRANAAQALGMIGDPAARPALEPLLQDPQPEVHGIAQRALERLQ